MKKIIAIFILLVTIPCLKAEMDVVKDTNFYDKVNDSIDNYYKKDVYLINRGSIPYKHDASGISPDFNYTKTGLLNLTEFLIAGKTKSYLFDQREYWMMSTSGTKNYYITINNDGYTLEENNNAHGIRSTIFVNNQIIVNGNGTYSNPWVFEKLPENIQYKVEHYQMTTAGAYPTSPTETETLSAATFSSVSPTPKTYTGFNTPSIQTIEPTVDGKSVIKYYYERKKYALTLNKGTGVASVNGGGTYYYGQSVNISATLISASGAFTWANWTVSGTNLNNFNSNTQNQTVVMNDGATTLTASATQTKFYLRSYKCANISYGSAPWAFYYEGNCSYFDDGNGNWRFKLLSNGNLKLDYPANIDLFLVGGGGGGAGGNCGSPCFSGGGGGGGYANTYKNISVGANTNYYASIGGGGAGNPATSWNGDCYLCSSSGGATTMFGRSANGGGSAGCHYGGSGGSAGGLGIYIGGGLPTPEVGKRYGNSAASLVAIYGGGQSGANQNPSTCEFDEGTKSGGCTKGNAYAYSSGGNGGCSTTAQIGGGGVGSSGRGGNGVANTGGGGAGGCNGNMVAGGNGGSGVVVIRNKR